MLRTITITEDEQIDLEENLLPTISVTEKRISCQTISFSVLTLICIIALILYFFY